VNVDIRRRDNGMDSFLDHLRVCEQFVKGTVTIHRDVHIDESMCAGWTDADGVGVHHSGYGSGDSLNLFRFPGVSCFPVKLERFYSRKHNPDER
jgi:hypothetical protein